MIDVLKELIMRMEALLEINDGDLFKGLRVCKLEIQLGKNPEVCQRREKS